MDIDLTELRAQELERELVWMQGNNTRQATVIVELDIEMAERGVALAESRQQMLILANRLEETDRRACEAEQRLAETNAALAVLAAALQSLNRKDRTCPFCRARGEKHREQCQLADAFSLTLVQQAVTRYREALDAVKRVKSIAATYRNAGEADLLYASAYRMAANRLEEALLGTEAGIVYEGAGEP